MCAGDEPQALNGIKALGGDRKLFHEVPHTYPVENPALITKALRKAGAIDRNDLVWVMDLQTVAAAGACLAEGVPLSQRIVASGGPAMAEPRHFLVTVGTPVNTVVPPKDNLLVLRGGLFKGMPVDSQNGTIGLADDALFAMPAAGKREMFAFINPGFNRRSIYPSCISTLTGAPDSHLSGTIRGERRPCVACSSCEKVCPAELMPQAIHRLLYGQEYDDAEALGLNLCVNCGACTYVCPSKIDLNSQFVEARRIIKAEKEAADAIAANTGKKK
jgi:Na+-transporting NADH:ubiquinone oxidoreductase subunit A